MESRPAHEINAGQWVIAEVDGIRTLCLKAERVGKDHVNHFLVPLDPVIDRRQLRLHYLDPESPLTPTDGYHLSFTPQDSPDVAPGDALKVDGFVWLKLRDLPSSQRLYCYVNMADGQVRPRMERGQNHPLQWQVQTI